MKGNTPPMRTSNPVRLDIIIKLNIVLSAAINIPVRTDPISIYLSVAPIFLKKLRND
jgi:hypothetical protein